MGESDNAIRILRYGLEDEQTKLLNEKFPQVVWTDWATPEEFGEKYETVNDASFNVVICGSKYGPTSAMEFSQALRNQCPETAIFFFAATRDQCPSKALLKNGFTFAAALPMDKEALFEKVIQTFGIEAKSVKAYKAVQFVDIEPQAKLPFDTFVYLPMNKKHVKFSKSGEEIGEKRYQRLEQKGVNRVSINVTDQDKFFEYFAERITRTNNGELRSETEKSEIITKAVRELFHQLFDTAEGSDIESGRSLVTNSQKLVSTLISGGQTTNWFGEMIKRLGRPTGDYDHTMNVSNLAALLSYGLKIGQPDHLAIAGLFHDIGLPQTPPEFVDVPESKWSEEWKKTYYGHPQASLNVLKDRRMILPPEAEKAILQHHEKFFGGGFPKNYTGDKISPEAQILSLADQIDEMTSIIEGRKKMTLEEAISNIENNKSINPKYISSLRQMLASANKT